MSKMLRITWKKSAIGRRHDQAETIRGLGFRKLYQTVVREDTKEVRGMIFKVKHLLCVEEVEE